jgi:hypothetical protein
MMDDAIKGDSPLFSGPAIKGTVPFYFSGAVSG